MEVPKNEERCDRIWDCSRCRNKGDKMCYQHSISYLFPVIKNNASSSDSGKSEEIIDAQKIISVQLKEDHTERAKIPEEEKRIGENATGIDDDDEEIEGVEKIRFVGEIADELNGRGVEPKECTQGVCGDVDERKERVAKKLSSLKLKDILRKIKRKKKGEQNDQTIPQNGVKVPIRGKKRGGKIAEKKRRKRGDDDNMLIKEGEEGGEASGGVKRRKMKASGKEEGPPVVQKLIKRRSSIDSTMCHQCHRSDKGRVIKCTTCKRFRFCVPCITNWYPRMTEDQVALACPICLGNCNCKTCLRMARHMKNQVKDGFKIGQEEKIGYSKNLLRAIFPFLKQFNQEQMEEKKVEAKVQGVLWTDVKLQNANFQDQKRVFCNNCRNAIVDYHRSCQKCKYDLCLTCCREVRAGQLQECEEVIVDKVDRGFQHLHGIKAPARSKKATNGYNIPTKFVGKARSKRAHARLHKNAGGQDALDQPKKITGFSPAESHFDDRKKAENEWTADENGTIPCPPQKFGGCGGGILELRSILSDGWVSELLKRAEQTMIKWEHEISPSAPEGFLNSSSDVGCGNGLRKCASREGSNDNSLFYPDAREIQHGDLKHFQWRWGLGEPIIVKSVLDLKAGLSWEPMVIWRAFREIGHKISNVKAINCSDWSEVDLTAHQFFKGYSQGRLDGAKSPTVLKLKDWPTDGTFEQRLPRHSAEFLRVLPFKEYTHPRDGVLNLAAKWPVETLKPDLGPKTYIAYGSSEELGCGDSVTKLHCHLSDMVNILVHTTEVTLHLDNGAHPTGSLEGSEFESDGALWDIFRREDVLKLEEYLRGHYREFRHSHNFPLNKVIHPIHDQTFYLTEEHKRKLKEGYGIEPWTFVQKLGEAVFIPAGCPHQVRNLKSCIKIGLGFVSPENVQESIRLTEELRSLPRNYQAKEDYLEVRKMIVHAVKQAVDDLEANQ